MPRPLDERPGAGAVSATAGLGTTVTCGSTTGTVPFSLIAAGANGTSAALGPLGSVAAGSPVGVWRGIAVVAAGVTGVATGAATGAAGVATGAATGSSSPFAAALAAGAGPTMGGSSWSSGREAVA